MHRSNLRQRKDAVLDMVIRQYIKTQIPVSSAFVADEYIEDISSATIRHILAELEGDGLLTHPHTSSGRVPTQRGYRYFVDFLMDEIELIAEERARIQYEYEREVQELESLIEKTSEIISDLTHCMSIVTLDGRPQHLTCRGMNYIPYFIGTQNIEKMAVILKMLEEKEHLMEMLQRDIDKRIKIYIGQETACDAFSDCALAVSRFQSRNGFTGRIAVLGSTRMDYQRVVSALEYVSNMMHQIGC